MNWQGVAFVVLALTAVFGGQVLRHWLWREHRAGRISGRRAGWTYASVAAAPYLLIAVIVALTDIGSLWMILLFLVFILPVTIVPYVAMFRYPHDK